MSEALTVTHVRVRADRIEAEVRVASERYRLTDGPLAKRALLAVPSLSPFFGAVLDHTTTPHLLEHLVVDSQTRQARDERRVFTGTTQAMAGDSLRYKVSISFEDDLVALSALRDSVRILNEWLKDMRG